MRRHFRATSCTEAALVMCILPPCAHWWQGTAHDWESNHCPVPTVWAQRNFLPRIRWGGWTAKDAGPKHLCWNPRRRATSHVLHRLLLTTTISRLSFLDGRDSFAMLLEWWRWPWWRLRHTIAPRQGRRRASGLNFDDLDHFLRHVSQDRNKEGSSQNIVLPVIPSSSKMLEPKWLGI